MYVYVISSLKFVNFFPERIARLFCTCVTIMYNCQMVIKDQITNYVIFWKK